METKAPVELILRIDWSELDLFKHVNNVAFMKYVQASRVNYWDRVGISQMYSQANIGPMLASTACQFKKPMFYPGNVRIEARVSFIKNTSFGIHHTLFDDAGDVTAEADDVMVIYDFNTNQKASFPADIRKIVEQIEGKLSV